MKAVYATLALFLCAGLASADVRIEGQAKVSYIPDIGYVTVGVSSKGKTAQEAWDRNNAVVAKLFEVLKSKGLDPKDYQTSNLSVVPEYAHPKDREPVLVGYVATYDLRITVRKLDDLGVLIDDLVQNGANRNVSIAFGLASPDRLLDEARVKAAQNAKHKANLYAQALGVQLGRVLEINEGSFHHRREMKLDMAIPGAAQQLRIAQGEQELTVTVNVVFGL